MNLCLSCSFILPAQLSPRDGRERSPPRPPFFTWSVFHRFWGGWGGLTAGMTGEKQSCCTWAFENTNKCGAGLWPAVTPLCRANPLSPFGRTRVWTWAICLNLRDISSHNGAQLALTTAHNTENQTAALTARCGPFKSKPTGQCLLSDN